MDELLVMNIPREGNADQLNKSTKLTLSSKKQYDHHLQGIPLNQHMKTAHSNQYQVQTNGLSQVHANRGKLNSTMMVKFNGPVSHKFSHEKTFNQRDQLNKSTLLPDNGTMLGSHNGMQTVLNGTRAIVHDQQIATEPNQTSLAQLNRSLNLQQMPVMMSGNQVVSQQT